MSIVIQHLDVPVLERNFYLGSSLDVHFQTKGHLSVGPQDGGAAW